MPVSGSRYSAARDRRRMASFSRAAISAVALATSSASHAARLASCVGSCAAPAGCAPGRELDLVHRLGQEVLGAQRQRRWRTSLSVSAVTITTGTSAALGHGLQAADEFEAIHHRHHVVEQDQVGLIAHTPIQRTNRIGKTLHLRILYFLQQVTKQGQIGAVVIDNQ
jgi:hypothetical protein